MRKESITYLDTENGQASRISNKEKLPMTDKRFDMLLQTTTKIIVVFIEFFFAGKVIEFGNPFLILAVIIATFISTFALIVYKN